MRSFLSTLARVVLVYVILANGVSSAAIITFDMFVSGETSFGFDGDRDGIDDVMFSTTDPFGFNTVGPGANQTYIKEPGLEGTSEENPDLRVDFLNGAVGPISFGFALNSSIEGSAYFASLRLFNAAGTELGSSSVVGTYTTTPAGISSFPEGLITVNFLGVASYGLFNFDSEFGRYIIDDFEGAFGSTDLISQIPEPANDALIGLGLTALYAVRRYKTQFKS